MSAGYPIFVKRDLDGFFGLAIDNLVQLLLIVSLNYGRGSNFTGRCFIASMRKENLAV